jgi:hypothetical protein
MASFGKMPSYFIYWCVPWLAAFVMILYKKVEKRQLFFAILIGWALLFLMVMHQHKLDWGYIHKLEKISPKKCLIDHCSHIPKPRFDGGTQFTFLAIFGWIPAFLYVGLCEVLYRERKAQKWGLFCWLWATLVMIVALYMCLIIVLLVQQT